MMNRILILLWLDYEEANLRARERYYRQRDTIDARYNMCRRPIDP